MEFAFSIEAAVHRCSVKKLPAIIYLFKFNNRNTRKTYGVCSKLTIKTPEQHHEVVQFFLLTLIYFTPFSCVPIVDFKQVNVCWDSEKLCKIPRNHPCRSVFLIELQRTCFPVIFADFFVIAFCTRPPGDSFW